MYKVYINNTLLNDEPEDLMAFMEVMERDDSIRCLLMKFPLKLTFVGDGYKILNDIYEADGFCGTQSLIIEQKVNNTNAYTQIFKGLIFLTNATANLNNLSIECAIEDDGFYSKIFNNKSIKAKLDVSKSKNGVTINPAASIEIFPFHPDTGVYESTTIRAFDIKEVGRFLLDFMSDLTIGFESEFLDNLPDDERICICRGIDIRSTGRLAPMISYKEWSEEIEKKYNLSSVIIRVNGKPVLRMEQDSIFYESDYIITIDNIDDLERSFNQERLYSKVKIGSSVVATYDETASPQPHSLPPVQFLGFQDEEYTVQGECNIDKELNLISNWVIDSNVIQDVLENAVTTYDDNIFLIQYDAVSLNAVGVQYLTGSTVPYLYNEQLLNTLVAPRWDVQGDIVAYLSDTDPNFKAVTTNDRVVVLGTTIHSNTSSPNQYQDDYTLGNDVNNVFGNGSTQGVAISQANSRFTAIDDGFYTFETLQEQVKAIIVGSTPRGGGGVITPIFTGDISLQFIGEKYSSADVLLESRASELKIINVSTVSGETVFTTLDGFLFSFNMAATNYVTVKVIVSNADLGYISFTYVVTITLFAGGYFRCISSSTAGGTIQPATPSTYKASSFTFKSGLSLENWNLIKANPSGAIRFNHDGITQRIGWVRRIARNIETSETDFELISNIANGN